MSFPRNLHPASLNHISPRCCLAFSPSLTGHPATLHHGKPSCPCVAPGPTKLVLNTPTYQSVPAHPRPRICPPEYHPPRLPPAGGASWKEVERYREPAQGREWKDDARRQADPGEVPAPPGPEPQKGGLVRRRGALIGCDFCLFTHHRSCSHVVRVYGRRSRLLCLLTSSMPLYGRGVVSILVLGWDTRAGSHPFPCEHNRASARGVYSRRPGVAVQSVTKCFKRV